MLEELKLIYAASDLFGMLGFGRSINLEELMAKATTFVSDFVPLIAVLSSILFFVLAIRVYIQARDAHDFQQITWGRRMFFNGLEMVVTSAIGFYFAFMA